MDDDCVRLLCRQTGDVGPDSQSTGSARQHLHASDEHSTSTRRRPVVHDHHQPDRRRQLPGIACSITPRWLGSLVVRALDLRLDGREFDFRPRRLIRDRLKAGKPP